MQADADCCRLFTLAGDLARIRRCLEIRRHVKKIRRHLIRRQVSLYDVVSTSAPHAYEYSRTGNTEGPATAMAVCAVCDLS